jgi:predicted transcriptional regulator
LNSQYFNLYRSELKLNILSSLLGRDKKLGALRDELGSSGSTIIHALKGLEEMKLTKQEDKHYKLTSLGVIEATLIAEASSAAEALDKFQGFWLQHDVTAIPSHLLQRIGALQDSTLIKDNSMALDRVHVTFQRLLQASRRVWGMSPIFHSDYVGAFQRLLGEGATVDLILTRGVLDNTLMLADTDQIIDYVTRDKLRIFMTDGLRVALTVTENSFSMGLYTNDGEYDYTSDLVSSSPEAIEWGGELFRHHLKQARRLDTESLSLL